MKRDTYIQTRYGVRFDFNNPKVEDVLIEDIAHALSMQCRFTGHTSQFYSVGEHSLNVSNMCSTDYKLVGLLHDASEAYLTDLATPIKDIIPQYKEIEEKITRVVFEKFGLVYNDIHYIKLADTHALKVEATTLIGEVSEWAMHEVDTSMIDDSNVYIECMSPEEAKEQFLRMFELLTTGKI